MLFVLYYLLYDALEPLHRLNRLGLNQPITNVKKQEKNDEEIICCSYTKDIVVYVNTYRITSCGGRWFI